MTDCQLDGNLPAALTRLGHTISALTDPKPFLTGAGMTRLDPLYTQLVDAVFGQTGERSGGRVNGAPLWVDALDVKTGIDTEVASWAHRHHLTATGTIPRLHQLEHAKWRPQDTHLVDSYTVRVEAWTIAIRALLEPPLDTRIRSAACPQCGTATVYRKDQTGDTIRQAALRVTAEGCRCTACRTLWGPDRFDFLAQLLDYNRNETLAADSGS